jgi:hypothetical protein
MNVGRIWLALPLLFAAGCEVLLPTDCTMIPRPGIVVTVSDSITSAPAAQGASGFVHSGSRSTAFEPSRPDATQLWAFVPTGRYTVTVEKAGYARWEANNVRVQKDGCGAISAELNARLQPLPDGQR